MSRSLYMGLQTSVSKSLDVTWRMTDILFKLILTMQTLFSNLVTMLYSRSIERILRRVLVASHPLNSRHTKRLFHSLNHHRHSSSFFSTYIRCPNQRSSQLRLRPSRRLRKRLRNIKSTLRCISAGSAWGALLSPHRKKP